MIIYNVTINIEESVHDNWLNWMQHTHIPDMLATGKFSKALMTRVLVKEENHLNDLILLIEEQGYNCTIDT